MRTVLKNAVSFQQSDHIQQIESLFLAGSGEDALPQLDISNQDFDYEEFTGFENDFDDNVI